MKKQRVPRDGQAGAWRRKHRRRRSPSWLKNPQFDAVARARCLMLLSVLSGEKPVTDAILEAKISRGTYYQLENRALNAMLSALNPLSSSSQADTADASAAASRIAQLEAQVQRLEQDKRRSQRLLLLTRKSIRGPVTRGRRGRPPKNAPRSLTRRGRPRSKAPTAKATTAKVTTAPSLTPTRAGESMP